MQKFNNNFVLIIFLLSFGLNISNANFDQKKTDDPLLQSQKLGDVISLDNNGFQRFIASKPRNYSVLALFTTSSRKVKCTSCSSLEKEFQVLASSYIPNDTSNSETLYFVKFDHVTTLDAFKHFELTAVPFILYIPSNTAENAKSDTKNHLSIYAQTSAEDIANFVRDRTGIRINVVRSQLKFYIALVVFFSILMFSVQLLIDKLPVILYKVRNPVFWMIICFGFYLSSISGFIYDIIHQPPSFYANPSGQIVFFHPQSGSQFVIEGFVIGLLNLTGAIFLIMLTSIIPRLVKHSKISNETSTYLSAFLFIGFLFCFYQVISLYTFKNNWYLRV